MSAKLEIIGDVEWSASAVSDTVAVGQVAPFWFYVMKRNGETSFSWSVAIEIIDDLRDVENDPPSEADVARGAAPTMEQAKADAVAALRDLLIDRSKPTGAGERGGQ